MAPESSMERPLGRWRMITPIRLLAYSLRTSWLIVFRGVLIGLYVAETLKTAENRHFRH